MSGALLDSNILIDLFNGVEEARLEWRRYDRPALSIVSWIEVMARAEPDQRAATRQFLSGFEIVHLDPGIAERAAIIRRERRIKLPDAIIQASAETSGLLLVTRNERDFPEGTPGVRVPYRL